MSRESVTHIQFQATTVLCEVKVLEIDGNSAKVTVRFGHPDAPWQPERDLFAGDSLQIQLPIEGRFEAPLGIRLS